MSDLSDWLSAVKSAAGQAAATITPAYTDVVVGAPVPRGRCVRVWWGGEAIPAPQMDGRRYSLNHELIAQRIAATVFEPMSDMSEGNSEAAMGRIADFVLALRTVIDEDRTLGGKSVSVEPDETPCEFLNIGGTLYAYASMTMSVGIIEVQIGS